MSVFSRLRQCERKCMTEGEKVGRASGVLGINRAPMAFLTNSRPVPTVTGHELQDDLHHARPLIAFFGA